MNYFWSADFHFGHFRMVAERGFESREAMDTTIIDNINKVVSERDKLYFLGDFCFHKDPESYRKRIRCKNIVLIFGNHDKPLRKGERWRSMFSEAYDAKEIKIGTQYIYAHHYACRVWSKSHYSSWHAFGHSHGSLPDDPNSLSCDVGIDCHNFKPVSFDELKVIMSRKAWKPVDHHKPREAQP